MIRRAFCRPGDWKNTLALATTMLSALTMVGCGGGGGGGNGGGGAGAVTGRVVSANVQRTPVPGATVTLRDSAGNVLATTTTSATGTFTFATVPAGAVLFRVDPPAANFFQEMVRFRSNDWAFNRPATAGGPCLPTINSTGGAVPAAGVALPDIQVFENTVPPPPVFGCPR